MADAWVLQAQQWVNKTYAGKAGYVPCPENGKPAWSTMYSLTRALQIELGIAVPSDAFGDGTMGAIKARGGIKYTDSPRILTIVQAALWVKGYFVYTLDGNAQYLWMGMGKLALDLGAPMKTADQALDPKLLKQAFRMDASVLVAGGSPAVREVQQWMNGKYILRRDFHFVPTDGHFGRDVQKAFLRVIQYELGMSDDVATGSFGPGTQNGLRSKTFLLGSSGSWVRIFSGALVFNGYGIFTDTWTGEFNDHVKKFQEFSALPVTTKSDFATWAQLLVSYGDPDRPATASDASTPLTPARASALRAAGVKTIGRYLDNVDVPAAMNKKIQPGELDVAFAAGLSVFPIQQYSGNALRFFTHERGRADAVAAHDIALQLGFPAGTTIYFSVDFDATDPEISSHVIPYFNGVVAGLVSRGKRYFHGVYACRNVCSRVTEETGALRSFVLGMSAGYSGNMGFKLPANWAFNQIQTRTVGTGDSFIEYDRNVHRPNSDVGMSRRGSMASTFSTYLQHVVTVEGLAKKFAAEVAVTPQDPRDLTLQYLRSRNTMYTGTRWKGLFGAVSDSFVAYVEARIPTPVTSFVDPFYGVEYDAPHFAASANIHYQQPDETGGTSNATDISSWTGDLFTFYADWRQASDGTASGYTFARDHLFKLSSTYGSFDLKDLLADADAVEVARAMTNDTSLSVAKAVERRWTGADKNRRVKTFFTRRFGNEAAVQRAAHHAMTTANPSIAVPRTALIQSTNPGSALPSVLPGGTLDGFTQGFAAELAKIASKEA